MPADANQLFPCFDQPDLKARVTFTLTTPLGWTALANGSLARADTSADRVAGHFTETRPLPTYLIAFAAGPWARFTSTEHGRTVNVFLRRSRAREADADTLLALQQRSIAWMERYFGRPYPFEKFDMLLAPAFPFGGMEHPGVIMYNEDRFIFRERPTLPRRLGRFSTILHETAHQWFGDLVTMRWFDDLWLKEGFATYMGAKALADLEPASDAWKTFYQSNKPVAYGVDQTTGTTPLWQTMSNLDKAKSAYGAIVYNKAPSVLKQLNYLVGDTAFQKGVRAFLTTHAYANATWQDLLGSIGRAAGRPLDGFGRNFMLRPGMPVVESRMTVRDGKIARLELIQRPAQPSVSGSAPWPMRTQVLLAYADQPAGEAAGHPDRHGDRCGRGARPAGAPVRVPQRRGLRLLPVHPRFVERGCAGRRGPGENRRRIPPGDALGRALGPGAGRADGPGPFRAAGAEGAAQRKGRAARAVAPRQAGAKPAGLSLAGSGGRPARGSGAGAVGGSARREPALRHSARPARCLHRGGGDPRRYREAAISALRRLGGGRAAARSDAVERGRSPAGAR